MHFHFLNSILSHVAAGFSRFQNEIAIRHVYFLEAPELNKYHSIRVLFLTNTGYYCDTKERNS